MERDRRTRQQHADMRDLRDRYESLTAREQEVMQQVISGLLNKQIAAELKITEDHGQVSSRAHHAQNACRFSGRSGEDGGEPGDPLASAVRPNVKSTITNSLGSKRIQASGAQPADPPPRCNRFFSPRCYPNMEASNGTSYCSGRR